MYFFFIILLFPLYSHQSFLHQSFPQELQITSNAVNQGKKPHSLIENGYYIVVWSEHVQKGKKTGIHGQVFNNLGHKYGNELEISTSTSYFQDHPSVAMQSDGKFLAVWESQDQDGDGYGVYGQFYEDFNKKLGQEFRINRYTIGDQQTPSVDFSYGYFVVTWQGLDDSGYGIYTQIYDSNGEACLENEVLINNLTLGNQTNPYVNAFIYFSVLKKFLNVVIVWESYNQENTTYELYLSYFNYDVEKKIMNLSGDVLIYSGKYQIKKPVVSYILYDDSYFEKNASILSKAVIAWQMNGQNFKNEIKAQIYNIWINFNTSSFIILKYGDSFKANTFLYQEHTNPSISLTNIKGFIICWQSFLQDGDQTGIFGQIFNSSGAKNGTEFQINVMIKGDQKLPHVAMNDEGEVFVIWMSRNFNSTGVSLNYQLYYHQQTKIKLRNFKTEILIHNFKVNNPIKTAVKILELEYSFVVVWADDIIYCEIFNTRQFQMKVLFSIDMKNSTDVAIEGINGDIYFIIIWRNTVNGNIYGQIFDSDAIALNNYFIMNELNDNIYRYTPVIKALESTSFFLVWIGRSQNKTNIYGRYFHNYTNGDSEFIVNDKTYTSAKKLNMEGNSKNSEILVVWVDELSEEKNYSVIIGSWLLLMDSSFKKKTGDFFIYNSTNLLDTYPSIALDPIWPKLSVIVWSDIQDYDSGENIYAQMIDSFGSKFGQCFQVNTFDKLHQNSPSVTLTNKFIFVVWSSFLQDSDGYGVIGAVFDLMGNRLLPEFQINTEYIRDQILPSIDSIGSGDLLIVWYSAHSSSIRAQKIVPDYQSDLFSLETLGFEILNKFSEESSICGVLSDDGIYAIIAIHNGYVQIINLFYLFVIEQIKLTEFEIMFMHKSGNVVYVGIGNSPNDLIMLNCEDFTHIELINSTFNISYGNSSTILIFLETYENYLYLGYQLTICKFDITNQTNPIFLSKWEPFGKVDTTTNYFFHIYLDKQILLVVDLNDFISIVDTENNQFKNISSFHNAVYTYATLLSDDQKYLFVGTKSGLEIYTNKNFTFTLSGLVSLSQFISEIHKSHDGKFLSLTSTYGHYLFSLSNPMNPELLVFMNSINQISSTLMTNDHEYILFFTKGGTIIQKVISMNTFATPYLVFVGYQYIESISCLFVQLAPSKEFVYGIDKSGSPAVFVVKNLSDSASALALAESKGQDLTFLIYAFDQSGLKIYEVANNIQFTLKGSLNLTYHDYLISSNQKFIYVAAYEKKVITFKIIDTNDSMNPKIISSINLTNYTNYPNLTFANSNESVIYATLEQNAIVVIDVNDTKNPKILNLIKTSNVELNLIAKFTNDIYIISNYERLFIYNLSNYTTMVLYSEMIPNGNKIYGIQTCLEKYIVVVTAENLILIDLHNISNPVLLDSIKLQSTLKEIPKIIAQENCIYIAFVQVYCLFGSLTNYLYADLAINPQSEQLEFIISFWPVNLMSTYTIKLIKFSNINTALNWISVDCENFKMIVNPTSYWDLKLILQPLEVIYATNILTQELNSEEINFLKVAGFIDNDYFITDKFNISQTIKVDNPNISSEKLIFILSKHYNRRKYYFETEKFLKLIPPSEIYNKVQDQLDKTTGTGGKITIDTEFSFYLSSTTSKNHYKTTLVYSASNLPYWMEFDSYTLRFSGTPGIKDLKDYNITVSVFNGYHTSNDQFTLKVEYFYPILNPNETMQSQITDSPQVEIESQIFISKNCFIDPNNATLTYSATLNNQILPSWIQFDEQNLMLIITPTAETFKKVYSITITAKNNHFSVSDNLTFQVETSWQYTLTIIAEIIGPVITLIGCIKYRKDLYNFFFKKYYVFPAENLYIDTYFEKEIYFIKKDLETASLFWKYLKKTKRLKILDELDIETKYFKETLANELKQIHNNFKDVQEINKELLKPESTIFVICECFWYHSLLKKNEFTKKVFNKMKFNLKKQYQNYWYLEIVSFKYYLIYQSIKFAIQSEKLEKGKKKINMGLIYAILKADALGIPDTKRKWYNRLEYSRGESCFMNVFEIQEIRAQRKAHGNKSFAVESFNNDKLPYWIKYRVKYGILTFYGTPPAHDEGSLNIILDSSGTQIRSLFFNILPQEKTERNKKIDFRKVCENIMHESKEDRDFDEMAYINKIL